MQTLYSALECTESATYEELKQSYQRLIRIHHPDKQQTSPSVGTLAATNCSKFVEIQSAWEILSKESDRRKYDATLLAGNLGLSQPLIYAELNWSECEWDENDTFEYPCRCGGNFELIRHDLPEYGDLCVECTECTNCIQINRGVSAIFDVDKNDSGNRLWLLLQNA